MAIQAHITSSGLGQAGVSPSGVARVAAKQPPFFIRYAILMFISLSGLILACVILAQLVATPPIIEPPPDLLPGNPRPVNTRCDKVYAKRTHCYVHYNGYDIDLLFDVEALTIIQTTLAAQQFTLGNLLAAWGKPSGFAQYGNTVVVYWGVRSAQLIACPLQLDSRVERITYSLRPQPALPWPGFTSNNRACQRNP